MTSFSARTRTDDRELLAGGQSVTGNTSACALLAAALASCARESITPLLERNAATAMEIHVTITQAAAANIRLGPAPGNAVLQQKLERAILRCPVAGQLNSPPRIEWHS